MPTGHLAFANEHRQAPRGKPKLLGSGGSMVAKSKLKGIDGGAHQKWSLRLNLTQRTKTYSVRTP